MVHIVPCHEADCIMADVPHEHVVAFVDDFQDPNNKEEPTMAQSQPATAQTEPVDEFRKAVERDDMIRDIVDEAMAAVTRVIGEYRWATPKDCMQILDRVNGRLHDLRNGLYKPGRSDEEPF